MTAPLEWAIEPGPETVVHLIGDINESSRLEQALVGVPSGTLVIDMGGVRRISSAGVRAWIDFVRAAAGRGDTLVYDRVPSPIVHQFHLVADFGGAFRVRSVMAPYFCSACDILREIQVTLDDPGFASLDRTIVCDSCGGPMDFDDVPEYYASLPRRTEE